MEKKESNYIGLGQLVVSKFQPEGEDQPTVLAFKTAVTLTLESGKTIPAGSYVSVFDKHPNAPDFVKKDFAINKSKLA